MIARHRQQPRTNIRSTVHIKKPAGANLVLNARIFSFRIFTNENGINVVVWCLVPGNRNAWANVGEKVESPSKGQVERNMTLSDCLTTISIRALGPQMGLTRCSQRTFGYNIRNNLKSAQHAYIPLRATVFFLIEFTAASGITVLPPFKTGVTSTSSHWIGT